MHLWSALEASISSPLRGSAAARGSAAPAFRARHGRVAAAPALLPQAALAARGTDQVISFFPASSPRRRSLSEYCDPVLESWLELVYN